MQDATVILVTSKYGKAAMCACIPAFIGMHSPRVNCGFNPIQQQPLHHSRQQQATHPHVPFFWTEKHLDLLNGRLGASISIRSFAVLSLKAIYHQARSQGGFEGVRTNPLVD